MHTQYLAQLDVIAMHSRAMAKPLHQLSPHHHQAVALRLAGERPQAIADSLGVERRTVYLWFSDPLVKDELERRSRDLAKLITERLADHTLAALSRLGEIIDLPLGPRRSQLPRSSRSSERSWTAASIR